ncbi:MAG: c-type cytochrome [Bryobacteraceae bacterium]
MKLVATALIALGVYGAETKKAKVRLPTARAEIAKGEKLFLNQCSLCHGAKGEGGRGSMLAVPKLSRAPDDDALVKVIEDGIPRTEMGGAWTMNEYEIRQVAAYVRTLGRVPRANVPGDPKRGEAVYRGSAGCVACHGLKNASGGVTGGLSGPELSSIGLRRSVEYLRAALLEPEAAVPDGFLQVRARLRDGRVVTGLRINEDTFSIQVRDPADRTYSFWKHELAELQRDKGKSPMPSYKDKLTPVEIDDLIAFLVSLREGS